MPLPHHIITAALLTGAACTAGAHAVQDGGHDAPFTCAVQFDQDGRQLAITARARATRDLQADYDLRIRRRGSGGASDIRQDGAVALHADAPVVLGRASLSAARDAVDVTLTVTADGHTRTCHQSRI